MVVLSKRRKRRNILYLSKQSQSQQWSFVGSSTAGTDVGMWQHKTRSGHRPLADDDCTLWDEDGQRDVLVFARNEGRKDNRPHIT